MRIDAHAVADIAVMAGAALRTHRGRAREIRAPKKDFLTSADLQAETYILAALSEFGDIPVLSEETGGEEKHKGRLWVVDPLDGSLNYWRGDHFWGISIALVKDGVSTIGTVYLPESQELFFAALSKGAYRETQESERAIHVSAGADIKKSQVWTDHIKGSPDLTCEIFRQLSQATRYPQVRLCATASLMQVAQGKIDGYIHPKPEPWDIAAAALIVEMAGGKATNFVGEPWTPFSESIIASNGYIHTQLLEIAYAAVTATRNR